LPCLVLPHLVKSPIVQPMAPSVTYAHFYTLSQEPVGLDEPTIYSITAPDPLSPENIPTDQNNNPEILKLQIQLAQIQLQLATL